MGKLKLISILLIVVGIGLTLFGFVPVLQVYSQKSATHSGFNSGDLFILTGPANDQAISGAPMPHSTLIKFKFDDTSHRYRVTVYIDTNDKNTDDDKLRVGSAVEAKGEFNGNIYEWLPNQYGVRHWYKIKVEAIDGSSTFSFRENSGYFLIVTTPIGMLLVIIGIVAFVLSLRGGSKVAVAKGARPVVVYEPTLQQQTGMTASGQAVASSQKQTKVSKQAAKTTKPSGPPPSIKKPATGSGVNCKFCGKSVPAGSYYCPHCYGKLK